MGMKTERRMTKKKKRAPWMRRAPSHLTRVEEEE